jgi:hypothetical protein
LAHAAWGNRFRESRKENAGVALTFEERWRRRSSSVTRAGSIALRQIATPRVHLSTGSCLMPAGVS